MDGQTEWQTKHYNPRCGCVPRVNDENWCPTEITLCMVHIHIQCKCTHLQWSYNVQVHLYHIHVYTWIYIHTYMCIVVNTHTTYRFTLFVHGKINRTTCIYMYMSFYIQPPCFHHQTENIHVHVLYTVRVHYSGAKCHFTHVKLFLLHGQLPKNEKH